ncbi:hypothetical protein ADUPG1_010140 [Aduncisulcus paluster]|uniref:Uncharacterized protein n=1 Tax=Aduncisulcus paluster TaxID=2918883 RepID=A0ABQ5KY20_9EUKA|nr:hypothetical protein ADUPG1_010140 [Aduncisulcus paluster]
MQYSDEIVDSHRELDEPIFEETDIKTQTSRMDMLENLSLRNGHHSTVYHPKGGHYKGCWKDGKRHGCGVQVFKSGDKYQGEWEESVQHGWGVYYKKTGDVLVKGYAGQFEKGRMHGIGTLYLTDGGKYVGQWKAGLRCGFGVEFLAPTKEEKKEFGWGSIYRGGWEDDRRSGKGILIKANGDVYFGNFANGLQNGLGEYFFCRSRNKFSGLWKDGIARCSSVEHWTQEDEIRMVEFWANSAGPWPGLPMSFYISSERMKELFYPHVGEGEMDLLEEVRFEHMKFEASMEGVGDGPYIGIPLLPPRDPELPPAPEELPFPKIRPKSKIEERLRIPQKTLVPLLPKTELRNPVKVMKIAQINVMEE